MTAPIQRNEQHNMDSEVAKFIYCPHDSLLLTLIDVWSKCCVFGADGSASHGIFVYMLQHVALTVLTATWNYTARLSILMGGSAYTCAFKCLIGRNPVEWGQAI
jgi:hypothetical protein